MNMGGGGLFFILKNDCWKHESMLLKTSRSFDGADLRLHQPGRYTVD
jgi:hypothetical protein